MTYSAAAAGPGFFNPGEFGDVDADWEGDGVEDWDHPVYDVPVASRSCCPNCRKTMPAEPLDVAFIHALPEGVVARPSASVSEPRSVMPKTQFFADRGQIIIGVHVGKGNPTAGEKFAGTDVYYLMLPTKQGKLVVRFICGDDPKHTVLLEPGEWNPEHPKCVVFDALFDGLSRSIRNARALKYISLANTIPVEL